MDLMRSLHSITFRSRVVQPLPALLLVGGLVTGGLVTSCTSIQDSVTELSLEVEPSSRAGTYVLSGRTNLPDGAEIMVQGVRQLKNLDPATTPLESDQFSILDRQTVKVADGQWEASLSVWQPAADGGLAEPWQIYGLQEGARFEPESQVVLTATTPPSNDAKALERQWEASKNSPDGQQIGFTTEGRWYLQAAQLLLLEPPAVAQASVRKSQAAIALQQNLPGTSAAPETVSAVEPEAEGAVMTKPLSDAALSPREQLQ